VSAAGIRVAITGKGGSGKTAFAAIATGLLARERERSLLAIDADSAVGLAYALGVKVHKTVAEIRREVIEDPRARQQMETRHVREIMREVLEPGDGFQLLSMGRPEGPGCFCATNDLLRYGIDTLSKEYDVVVIDCEAGPEQVNRRVVNGVESLIVVTDCSARGMHAAHSIHEVVQREMSSVRTGLVVNRIETAGERISAMAEEAGMEVLGQVPEDGAVAEYDSLGQPLIGLPEDSPAVVAVRDILQSMGLGFAPEERSRGT
jgi:CO dehydrogenase maturation factor